ncbi:MAG: amino acid-binding protein, partial [Methanosarcinaceae archaeon]
TRFEDSGINVVRSGEERFLEHGAVIMIGHIIHTDIQDTIDKIDRTGFAEVVDLSLSMPRIDVPSSALLKIDAIGKQELSDAMSLLKAVADKKDLLVIEPIDTELM